MIDIYLHPLGCARRFVTKYIPTVGVDYGVKPVDIEGRQVRERADSVESSVWFWVIG